MPIWQRRSSRSEGPASAGSTGRFSAPRITIIILALGLLGTILTAGWSLDRTARYEVEDLANQGELLVFSTKGLLEEAAVRITAGGSLFRASSHVTPFEFRTFVGDTGLMAGVLGFGYVPVVADEDLDSWLELTRREIPDLELFELNEDDRAVALSYRELRFPLLYFEPVDLFSAIAGLDLGFHDDWRDDLVAGLSSDGIVATTFIELGLPGVLDDADQFIVGWPIADAISGEVSELVIAVIDMGTLINANVSADVTDGITWQVTDVTDAPIAEVADAFQSSFEFGGRSWLLTVWSVTPPSGLLSDAVVHPLLAGLILTLLMVALGRLLVARVQTRRELATLESLNLSKDDFLAAVSHRLRTPLTSVVGFSEILRDSDPDMTESDRRELVSTIAVQAIELGHLFDNLLTVRRNSGQAVFSPARVELASEIYAVLDTVEPARRAKVRVSGTDPAVVAAGDPGLIRQIVRNLIANATDYGDRVEVSVVCEDHVAKVIVRDNGLGVPPERVSSIFDLYQRSSSQGQPDSMGVGLFVSRRLARRMSGNVTYQRCEPWTVFELTLPAIPATISSNGSEPSAQVTAN